MNPFNYKYLTFFSASLCGSLSLISTPPLRFSYNRRLTFDKRSTLPFFLSTLFSIDPPSGFSWLPAGQERGFSSLNFRGSGHFPEILIEGDRAEQEFPAYGLKMRNSQTSVDSSTAFSAAVTSRCSTAVSIFWCASVDSRLKLLCLVRLCAIKGRKYCMTNR